MFILANPAKIAWCQARYWLRCRVEKAWVKKQLLQKQSWWQLFAKKEAKKAPRYWLWSELCRSSVKRSASDQLQIAKVVLELRTRWIQLPNVRKRAKLHFVNQAAREAIHQKFNVQYFNSFQSDEWKVTLTDRRQIRGQQRNWSWQNQDG